MSVLAFIFAVMISSSSVASKNAPPLLNQFPNTVKPLKVSFSDPYVTNCSAYELSRNYQPNHALQIQVTFDQAVPAPYYVVVSVYGIWNSQPGGASERFFTVLFPTGWSYKIFNFPMAATEEAYTELTYAADYGPQ
jgi:hypothetical protein